MRKQTRQEVIDKEVRAQMAAYFDMLLRDIGRIERCPDRCADKLCDDCALGIGLALDTLKSEVKGGR